MMRWDEPLQTYLADLPNEAPAPASFPSIINLIDLTRLNDDDDKSSIALFCEKAQTRLGHVAAICIHPSFVKLAAATFKNTPIKIATVANFPEGTDLLDNVLMNISQALKNGANEIDLVFPYLRYLAGDTALTLQFITACKALCTEGVILKVILETGALKQPDIIADAARHALIAGADFIKTSTGKISQGASPEAAAAMLLAIKDLSPSLKRPMGLKISGGIREIAQIVPYLTLANRIMGANWISPTTFRIGSSHLVNDILAIHR